MLLAPRPKTALGLALIAASLIVVSSAAASEPIAEHGPTADDAAVPADPGGEVPPVPNPSPLFKRGSSTVSGFSGPTLRWKWQRFAAADYFITGAGGALTLATAIIKPRSVHAFSGGILFDDSVRNVLRAHSLQARYDFRDASDVGLSLSVTWPFFADALTSAWWYRGSNDVAEQMALIDLETLAIAGAAQGLTNTIVSRQRPYGPDCGSSGLPARSIDCQSSQEYRSFFSGHATFSFAGAALICVHHFENDLLGSPWDALSCAGGYAVAATTSTFRVVGDMHYTSDVLLGALVGTAIGYGVPLLHYRSVLPSGASHSDLKLMVVPAAGGVGVVGIF